jgi:hypothetical protein
LPWAIYVAQAVLTRSGTEDVTRIIKVLMAQWINGGCRTNSSISAQRPLFCIGFNSPLDSRQPKLIASVIPAHSSASDIARIYAKAMRVPAA